MSPLFEMNSWHSQDHQWIVTLIGEELIRPKVKCHSHQRWTLPDSKDHQWNITLVVGELLDQLWNVILIVDRQDHSQWRWQPRPWNVTLTGGEPFRPAVNCHSHRQTRPLVECHSQWRWTLQDTQDHGMSHSLEVNSSDQQWNVILILDSQNHQWNVVLNRGELFKTAKTTECHTHWRWTRWNITLIGSELDSQDHQWNVTVLVDAHFNSQRKLPFVRKKWTC